MKESPFYSIYWGNNRVWQMLNWMEGDFALQYTYKKRNFGHNMDKLYDPNILANDLELEAGIELIAPGYSISRI